MTEQISAEEFIEEELGFSIVRLLGSGWHGSVYEVAAPTPQGIKVTVDFTEAKCVEDLVKHRITNPHLPEIFAHDSIPWSTNVRVRVEWTGWSGRSQRHYVKVGDDHGVFWYLKEIVDPLPYKYPSHLDIDSDEFNLPSDPWWNLTQSPQEEELKRLVKEAVNSLRRNGVDPKDPWNLDNWGYREADDTLVYLDLSCSVRPRKRFLGLF